VIDALDELRRIGEELRQVFADERHAISALDHARLEAIATHKRALAERLGELREPALATGSAAVRDLFAAIRVEAHATAMLAAAASQTVRAMLGYESTGGYDRKAQRVITGPIRLLAAY
jgi:hypothetical protein